MTTIAWWRFFEKKVVVSVFNDLIVGYKRQIKRKKIFHEVFHEDKNPLDCKIMGEGARKASINV